jgi:hypothetical protein
MFRFLTGAAVVLAVCLPAVAQEPADVRASDHPEVSSELPGGGARTDCASGVADCGLQEAEQSLLIRSPRAAIRNPSPPTFGRPPAPTFERGEEKDEPTPPRDKPRRGFDWKAALEQSALLLAVQHGYAMTQPKTRRELRGPFFRDYFQSVGNLHGWGDGGRFFTNYVAHPLQGAATGFIQVQNDPAGIRRQFGASRAYWRSRLRALGWSALNSTQFELGPVSQASLGNVGQARKLTYVDLVVTPTVGTALLVGEDALDRLIVRRIESRSDNFYLRVAARMLLNPARSCANLLRFKKPWHRDTR